MEMKVPISTPFFGIPLWALLLVASIIVVTCVILCFCFICYPRKKPYKLCFSLPKSIARKHNSGYFSTSSLDKKLQTASGNVSEHVMNFEKLSKGHNPDELVITEDGYLKGLESCGELCSVVNGMSKGCCFSLKEIEDITNGLAKENVIGSGDNGIVYLGLLPHNRQVAVKRLACDSRQPEELFASQMEAIRRVKHNNLVELFGYCSEGAYRMSVSEYVENESLHHWLHEFPVLISPLTWDIRMNIIHGVAKGCSSYQAPDCHSSSTLTEGSEIYDFGLFIVEIVSGRIPSYQSQPQAHYIVDWFKSMISDVKIENVVNPKLLEMPTSMVLKRVALVALRCVAPDVNPILKMGDVVHMLETNLLLFEERQIAMETYEHNHSPKNQQN